MISFVVFICFTLILTNQLCASEGDSIDDTADCLAEPEDNDEAVEEPDYEESRKFKKYFGAWGPYIGASSHVEIYKESNETECQELDIDVVMNENTYPEYPRDRTITFSYNCHEITIYTDYHSWSIDKGIIIDGKHVYSEFSMSVGFNYKSEPMNHQNNNKESETPEEGSIEEAEPDESSEPKIDEEYRFEKEFEKINPNSYYSLVVSLELYAEPQENNNSDGLDINHSIERLEPSYRGSVKDVSITYNNNGVSITRNGPDAGLNQGTSIEIESRHVCVGIESEFSTGCVPVCH